MDPYVELAVQAIGAYVREGRIIAPPDGLPAEMNQRAGTFVSLKKAGELRGCIGTIAPTKENTAHEIIANAIKTATSDPRFPPVREEELVELEYSVDVLSQPEPCRTEDLDPKRYGVIVEKDWKRGLLLPDLPGVNTGEEQLEIARRKAGIEQGASVKLYRFTVERHTQGDA
jgi:AmmeMemoRadiSam system protein A